MVKNTNTFKKRTGTTDWRQKYEDLILSLFSLRLALNPQVQDFWIYSKHAKCGSLNIILLEIVYKEETKKIALQLNYNHDGASIPIDRFVAGKGEMSIQEIKQKLSEISEHFPDLTKFKYAIYTNRECNFDKKMVVVLKKTKQKKEDSFVELKTERIRGHDILDTSKVTEIYKFTSGIVQNVEEGELENLQDFLNRFLVYFCQKNVTELERNLQSIFQGKFQCSENVQKNYVEFVENWSKLKEKAPLDKATLRFRIAEMLLKPYSITNVKSDLKMAQAFEIFTNFDITIIDKPVITSYCKENVENTDILSMWHSNKVPLIVNATKESPRKYFKEALNLCQWNGEKRKVILQGSGLSRKHFPEFTVLEDCSNLDEGVLKTFKLSLEGRETTLDCFGKEARKAFRILQLLQMFLGFVSGPRYDLSNPYFKRVLRRILFKNQVLENLPKNTILIISDVDKLEVKNEFIIMKDVYSHDETLNFSEEYRNFNIHHLSSNNLEWRQTCGSFSEVKKYAYVSDCFIKDSEILGHYQNKINIIIGESGMGKTELMKFLRQQCPPRFWPLKVDLREHFNLFKESPNLIEIKKSLLTSSDDLIRGLLNCFEKQKLILFLWDGVNELPEICIENFISCVHQLREQNFYQWITATFNLKDKLENEFNTFSLRLVPFSEEQQIEYVHQTLGKEFYDKKFPKELAFSTPLELNMLTEIYTESSPLLVTDVYKQLIYKRFNFFNKKIDSNDRVYLRVTVQKDQQKYWLQKYKKLALFSSFDEEILKLLRLGLQEESVDILNLVNSYENQKPIFIHRRYSEFLSAWYLMEQWRKLRSALLNIIFEEKYENIIYMFDMLMTNGSKAHQAILMNDLEMLRESDCSRRDLAGRNPLHIASNYGQKLIILPTRKEGDNIKITVTDGVQDTDETFETMLTYLLHQDQCSLAERDRLLDLTVVDYAIKAKNLFLLEIILESRSQEIDLSMKNSELFEHLASLVYFCVRFNYVRLFELIDDIPFIETEDEGDTLLHVAARFKSCTSIMNKLLENKSYREAVNRKNKNGLSALDLSDDGCSLRKDLAENNLK